MVGQLRPDRQLTDPGAGRPRQAEVERGNPQAGDRAAPSAAHAGAVEHHRPEKAEAEVDGHGGREPAGGGLVSRGSRMVPAA